MLSISLLLHLHQPPTQFPEVLRRVTDQCYRPLVNLLSKYPKAHLTINLTRSLIEQLESVNLAAEVAPLLKDAVARGQVELTGTAAYHILLPKLPKEEVIRQIKLNEETLAKYFGVVGPINGFFPPEMGIDQTSVELLRELGYQWVVVDEGAISENNLGFNIYDLGFKNRRRVKIVVRNKDLSLKIAFGVINNFNDFISSLKSSILDPKSSIILAMDGETFGHHQPALMPFLEELMKNSGAGDYRMTTISELINEKISENLCFQSVTIHSSTWSDDWLKWDNQANEIHALQWKLTNLAIKTVQNSQSKTDEAWLKARSLLDRALHSDQYWWASLRPNWHYQIVERGARMLRDSVLAVPVVTEDAKLAAGRLYEQITKTGLAKYGETVIV